jgi:hypothetical protein
MANVDPRIVEYLQSRGLDSPAVALDLEGLRQAQEEEEQIRHMQAVGMAGEKASALARGRAPDYERFKTPQIVKSFLERQGLLKEAEKERDAQAAAILAAQKAAAEEELRKAQVEELRSRPAREAAKLERALTKDEVERALRERRLDVQEQMQREQLRIARQRVALENKRIGQDVYSAIADPVSGGIIKYNKKTGEATPLTGGAGLGGKQPYLKPLTETQGQAAMFLRQSENALKQAMKMGAKILPSSGMAGGKEKAAWFAREHGVPQLSSKDELARQSLLLSIAEPLVRSESGAAVPPEEVRRLALRYVPSPGEPKEEQARKLRSLVGAIRAVQEKLPPAKAAEFDPFYNRATAWAADILGEGGSGSGSILTPLADPDSYYE